MDFKSWIVKFKNENNKVGDLASDINEDVNFPITKSKNVVLRYFKYKLVSQTISEHVIEIIENIWGLYESEQLT